MFVVVVVRGFVFNSTHVDELGCAQHAYANAALLLLLVLCLQLPRCDHDIKTIDCIHATIVEATALSLCLYISLSLSLSLSLCLSLSLSFSCHLQLRPCVCLISCWYELQQHDKGGSGHETEEADNTKQQSQQQPHTSQQASPRALGSDQTRHRAVHVHVHV